MKIKGNISKCKQFRGIKLLNIHKISLGSSLITNRIKGSASIHRIIAATPVLTLRTIRGHRILGILRGVPDKALEVDRLAQVVDQWAAVPVVI